VRESEGKLGVFGGCICKLGSLFTAESAEFRGGGEGKYLGGERNLK